MNVPRIDSVDFNTVRQVITSPTMTRGEKAQFLKIYRTEVREAIKSHPLSGDDYKYMMDNRPLQVLRPFKNSYTKWGDKILLGKTLDKKPSEIPKYVEDVSSKMDKVESLGLAPDKVDAIKTYVYRHGTPDQLVAFLDYELRSAGDILGVLYRTLSYNTGGAADYFVRPIHRMNNTTMVNLYNIIDKNLNQAKASGQISETNHERVAKMALVRIYEIQNNSKLINAVRLRNKLA